MTGDGPRRLRCFGALVITAATAAAGCVGDRTANGGPVTCPDGLATAAEIAATPRADAEAEGLALTIDRSLVAAESVYQRVRDDLTAIRALRPDLADIRYHVAPDIQSIYLDVPRAPGDAIASGAFHDWDCLNALYRLRELTVTPPTADWEWYGVSLQFQGRYQSRALLCQYVALTGAVMYGADGIHGDGPTIYAQRDTTEPSLYHYAVDRASGDCPAGCIYHDVYGFDSLDGAITAVGEWNSDAGAPRPEWLERLMAARSGPTCPF